MVALGTQGDTPPNSLQPPLKDGIHLRWSFDPEKGFPWYGYYLFRRGVDDQEPRKRCLSGQLGRVKSGPWPDATLAVGFAELVSDRPLVFTDEFPPAGTLEVDLVGREYVALRLPAGQESRGADVTIGFRRDAGRRTCVDFRGGAAGKVDNPLSRGDAEFLTFGVDGKPAPSGRIVSIGLSQGWDTHLHSEISLPCAASRVELWLVTAAAPAKALAFDDAGAEVDAAVMTGDGPELVTLQGQKIRAVHINAGEDETILLNICWTCGADGGGGEQRIAVRANLAGIAMTATDVVGKPGDVIKVALAANAFDEVVVGPGDAALVELCVTPVRDGLNSGWKPLAGVDYPICLPVANGDYPCPGAPGSSADAQARALGRIRYGPAAAWAGAPLADLHGRLDRLVVGGPPPGGEAMHDRFEPVPGPALPPTVGGTIVQRQQRPLDLILVSSLHPAIAEMVGLAWLDSAAQPGVHYDYLLLADHDGSLGGTASSALNWLASVADFTVIDGFVCFDAVAAPATPVQPPTDAVAFALPGGTFIPVAGGDVIDATNNAGLVWNRQQIGDVLAPGAPIMYHAWRAELGDVQSPPSPADGEFQPITAKSPIPVGRSKLSPPTIPDRPVDWPPLDLYHIDRALRDGWYAYRVSAIDIFGRHSANSVSAQWRQWAPAPSPRPWYYQDPPGDQVINGAAVRLLDKIAPPAPPGVEAFALAPDDPTVLHDAAWQAWQGSLSLAERASVTGLRVRWRWTVDQQRQAPDTREFRVFFQPGLPNVIRGRVSEVVVVSDTESEVITDIAHGEPADGFGTLSVRVGAQSFVIVGSSATSPLRLRVRNVGPLDEVRPPARTRCAITIPVGHALYRDLSSATGWQDRLLVVGFDDHVTFSGAERRYEILQPLAGAPDRGGLPLATTLEDPLATAVVGVTAADDKTHTLDPRGDAARYGNESRVGGPATVVVVRRASPDTPPVPPDSPRLFASPADYHGCSYFTYRWLPAAHLRVFVYRALDDAVFRADFARRPRPALDPSDLRFFPAEATDPAWNSTKRQQVADELNALNAIAPGNFTAAQPTYRGLSNDGLRVLAALSGIQSVFTQMTPQALDPDEPDPDAPDGLRWRRVGPDVPAGSLGATERAYVDRLDGRADNRWFYRCAYVDEVYNIGALGLASPPVWLPKVTPSGTPAIVRIRGGERRITLEWSANRERDLAEYRVYRADNDAAARDIRLMSLVHTEPVPTGEPADRPPTVSWTDEPVPGLTTFRYRLVAVDDVGNVSAASAPQPGRAHDQALPVVPQVTTTWVVQAGRVRAQLEWTSDFEVRVQRREGAAGTWVDLTSWRAPGSVTIRDPFSEPTHDYEYRLWARKYTGAIARGVPVLLEAQ
jgi:hypothetical protein